MRCRRLVESCIWTCHIRVKTVSKILSSDLYTHSRACRLSIFPTSFQLFKSIIRMNTNSQRSTERHFLQHSFSLLQRKSGQVVKTESWTASSFEVNKGQKLGSGGFSNVYRLRTLAHRLPSKNLPPRLRPRQVFSTTQLPYLTPHFLDANE